MNALRLFALTGVVASLAAPIAASAPPEGATSACTSPSRTNIERRIEKHAGRGMQSLVAFVHRTQPFYQLTVEDTVASVDSERERRTACMRASAEKPAQCASGWRAGSARAHPISCTLSPSGTSRSLA